MNDWIRSTVLATLLPVLLMVSYVATAAQPAQQDLSGMWQGKLAVDAKTSLTIQFTFAKDAKGAYTATLNSPDNPALKNTPATGVSYDGTNLKLQVAALSGSYAGTLKGGKFEGQWTQPGGALPLALAPYQKPVLTKGATDTLTGAWNGPMSIAGGTYTLVLRFKNNDKGEMTGSVSVPETGGQETPMTDIEFADNKLSFRLPQVQASFSGTLAGGVLNGVYKQPAPGLPPDGLPVVMKKGDVAVKVNDLKFAGADAEALRGKWQGTISMTSPQGQQISLPIVLRFETNAQGQFVGFIDSPSQKAMGIPVTEASLAAGKLSVKVGALRAEYTATLDGKTMTGQWSQGPASIPLTLTK